MLLDNLLMSGTDLPELSQTVLLALVGVIVFNWVLKLKQDQAK